MTARPPSATTPPTDLMAATARRHGARPALSSRRAHRGAALILMLFMIGVMAIMSAFAINLAQIQLVRSEMKVATDASARAASRTYASTRDMDVALRAAQAVADKNLVNSAPLRLRRSDFDLGTSVRRRYDERYQYTSGGATPNAVTLRVTKSDQTPSGPVRLFFPNLLGQQTISLSNESVSTQVEIDIVLVIDRSGSMAYAANEIAKFPPAPRNAPPGWMFGNRVPPSSRWLDTVAAVNAFLSEMQISPQRERVGLVTYADSAKRDFDLSEQYDPVSMALARYSERYQSGGTNIGGGLTEGLNTLVTSSESRPWATKVLLLMTDGIHNTGPDPIKTAVRIADQGVMIFTVTFSDEADRGRMAKVASLGGGKHYHARSAQDLLAVFTDIARNMPTLITK